MKSFLYLGAVVCVLAGSAFAQSTAPTPRPSAEERAVLAEDRAANAEALTGSEGPAMAVATRALTVEEQTHFVAQIRRCWNIGSVDPEAELVAVVVGFEMTPDALPIVDSIELISAASDDPSLAEPFFQAARRAIVGCTGDGYDLPAAAYAQWQSIEMTFDPNQVVSR